MLTRPAISTQIKVLPENTLGEDIIVGDIHGNAALLKHLVQLLDKNDRLFIVGDLIDKGPDCLAVIQFLESHWESDTKPEIYITKGNHEQSFLDYARDKINNLDATKSTAWLNYPGVGGQWALELTMEELTQAYNTLIHLPIIIQVNDTIPFLVVHADMPFDDDMLKHKLRFKLTLNFIEIDHATYRRKQYTSRDASQMLVYCGHDIILDKPLACIRKQSNTINLDTGAYLSNCLVAVRHKQGIPFLVGTPIQKDFANYNIILDCIDNYLFRRQKNIFRAIEFTANLIKTLEKDLELDTADENLPTKIEKILPLCKILFVHLNNYKNNPDSNIPFHLLITDVTALKWKVTPSFWHCRRFFMPENKVLKEVLFIEKFLMHEKMLVEVEPNKTLKMN